MPLSFYSLLVSVPSPRARESARGEAFLHIVWQSRLIRPSELFFTLYAHEVTFGDVARRSSSGWGGGSTGFRGRAHLRAENPSQEPQL